MDNDPILHYAGEKTISARRETSMPTAGSKTPQDYEHYCELVSASPSDSLTSRLEQLTSDTAQASAGDRQKIQVPAEMRAAVNK